MKAPAAIRVGVRGTIMIFALIVILASTLVLAGWAQMLMTATIYPDTAAESVKNRIALENARAMARQYMLVSLPSGATANNVTWEAMIAGGTWGACSVNAAASFWSSTNQLQGNPLSPIGGFSFVVTNLATFSNSVQSVGWRFLVKSRSPLLAGYPLVVQNPANYNSTVFAWITNSSVIYWTNLMTNRPNISGAPQIPIAYGTNTNALQGFFSFPSSAFTFSATNQSGTALTNVSYPVNTFSSNTAVLIPTPTTNGTNVTRNFTNGRVDATLSSTQVSPILRYDVTTVPNVFAFTNIVTNAYATTGTNYYWVRNNGRTNWYSYEEMMDDREDHPNRVYTPVVGTVTNYSTNRYIDRYSNSSVSRLTIVGSTATNSLHVVIPDGNTSTTNVILSGTNNTRRVYLSSDSDTAVTVNTSTTNERYVWWLAASMGSAPITIRPPTGSSTSLTITGGVRSATNIVHANYDASNPKLFVVPATNSSSSADPVEFIGDRVLWIEDGRSR